MASDPCVYIRQWRNYKILSVYVDNIVLTATSAELLAILQKLLHDTFQMASQGQVSRLLGTEILKDEEAGAINIIET